jgi:hypothetical protein
MNKKSMNLQKKLIYQENQQVRLQNLLLIGQKRSKIKKAVAILCATAFLRFCAMQF